MVCELELWIRFHMKLHLFWIVSLVELVNMFVDLVY